MPRQWRRSGDANMRALCRDTRPEDRPRTRLRPPAPPPWRPGPPPSPDGGPPLRGRRDRRDCRVPHVGMREQQVLALLGVDVLAATAEHVVDPAAKIEKAFAVSAEDVAGAQPAVVKLLPRDLRLVVIAEKDIRTANDELAFVAL